MMQLIQGAPQNYGTSVVILLGMANRYRCSENRSVGYLPSTFPVLPESFQNRLNMLITAVCFVSFGLVDFGHHNHLVRSIFPVLGTRGTVGQARQGYEAFVHYCNLHIPFTCAANIRRQIFATIRNLPYIATSLHISRRN